VGDEVEQVLAEEREHLSEDLQRREEFDENSRRECEQEICSYYEDNTFCMEKGGSLCRVHKCISHVLSK
jgi:hypothetical protein